MATETEDQGESRVEDPAFTGGEPGQPGTPPGTDQEPETFDREYVQKLRDEAAANRVKAKRADDAEARLRTLAVEAATRGILTSPDDLGWSDEYADEDGWPDPAKVTAAAEALVAAKPYLARPSGDVGQGRHSESDDAVSLSGLLRAGA